MKHGTYRFLPTALLSLVVVLDPSLAQPSPKAPAAKIGAAGSSTSEKAAQAAFARAKATYQAGQFREADAAFAKVIKAYPKSAAAEEAAVLQVDAQIRVNRVTLAASNVAQFRRNHAGSPHLARMEYYGGLAAMKLGRNPEAARAFAAAASTARVQTVRENAAKALRHLLEGGGLSAEDLEATIELLEKDKMLEAEMVERLGDLHMSEGRYQAARTVYSEWLEKFSTVDGAGRVKDKRRQAEDAPRLGKTILLMAPMSGEFAEIGRSLKEGAQLAIDEHNQRGGPRVDTRVVDDQGNMITGIHRLRKALREEKVDALVGPAMSDVSAAAAVDLSARKSAIPMVTPTATTHGIAALGEGVFQLNVTTGTLGQKIASYAMGCLKLKDFAIVAPESEYGYQLAEAFQRTVERKGGTILSVQYFVPGVTDMAPQFLEVRKAAIKLWLERRKAEGVPEPDGKEYQKIMSDTTIPLDGLFLPATNGEEANILAGTAAFSKLRTQMLGSSGWNDKALLHKSGTAFQGAYFSVDFPENPKTDVYLDFSRAFNARWKRSPDKVAALAYDAARFVLQGMAANRNEGQLIPTLRGILAINGVLGRIAFDEKYGANTNAALLRVEKRGFKEVEACPEAE
ncbi:MAG TPA: ABC transporter substrate-binding protein [Fibrobacteria bacterium]|nr:ABC transporter substrate-binding protein [Fibrobacteria bacterium]